MNMSRTSKILGFSVPPTVVKEVETLAKEERRTKSELFREMVRVYRRYRQQRQLDDERVIMALIAETKAEEAKNPTSAEELASESKRLSDYGAAQAKKLGVKTANTNRIIHERRKASKTQSRS
jgi:metal-responsive CopG/Arc/MetJ family transcriptional regulator